MAKPKVTVTESETGWDVNFNDEHGIVGVNKDQAKNEKEAVEVAKSVHADLVKLKEEREA